MDEQHRGGSVADVRLGTFPSWTEAEMFAQVLRLEGIPCVLVPLVPFDGWGSSVWATHEIRVAASDTSHARELLTEWRAGAGPVVLPGE